MSEEFSKLSIKSKSVTSSQSMMWVIPQSRLDRQCPFLEKEYPYFTTDFSMLHYSVKDLEVKLKLILERKDDSVQLSLSCLNDNVMFDKKEFRHMEIRFCVEIKESIDSEDGTEAKDSVPSASLVVEDFQELRFGQARGVSICDIKDFDSMSSDGRFLFAVNVQLEYFQQARKKFSILQQAKRFSSSISDLSSIYSKTRQSLSSGLGLSSPSRSWIGKTLPNLRRSSLGGRQAPEQGPTYQQCSVPSPPSPPVLPPCAHFPPSPGAGVYSASPNFPQAPAIYKYRQPGKVTTTVSGETGMFSLHNEVLKADQAMNVRRTKSGRLPSVVETLTKADDTLDSRVSSTMDLVSVIPSYQHMHDHEPDHTYSSIPDNVFSTPLPLKHLAPVSRSPSALSQTSSFSPTLQRCASTPNPASKRQRYEARLDTSHEDTMRSEYYPNVNYFQDSSSLRRTIVSANQVGLPTANYAEQRMVDSPNQEAQPRYAVAFRKDAAEIVESLHRQNMSDLDGGYCNALKNGFIPNAEDIKHDKRFLLEFAATQGLHKLKNCCEEVYMDSLNTENSLESLLVFDNLLPSSLTKRKIVMFIRNNLEEVYKSKHWSDFQRHCPVLVEEIMAKKPAWFV